MTLARGLRAIIEDMAQMAATAAAMAFGAQHEKLAVLTGADRIRQRLIETGPSGAAVNPP